MNRRCRSDPATHFVDKCVQAGLATHSQPRLSARTFPYPTHNYMVLATMVALTGVEQVVYSTCRFHTNGINMMCMDCLVISGYVLPVSYHNPYVALVPPGSIQPQSASVPGLPETMNANNMFSSHEETYMYKMRFALQEMDNQFGFVPNGYFLDLG